ncbi:MAG: MmgE/PrpD family protein [Oscillospiraceae bacterium]
MMNNLYRLADFLAALRWEDLPPEVQQAAVRCTLDTFAAAAGACDDPLLRKLEPAMTRFSGDSRAVSLWGTDRRTDLQTGVLLNAMAAHTLELDDVHAASKTHIGSVAVPAAWGLSEQMDCTGRELLLAVVCAYEATSRIGMALGVSSHRNRGWHATGTAGVFGAAAACGKLLALDGAQMVSALGMAGTQASGLWSFLLDGATSKILHPARAAVSGLDAALLAQAGMKGTGHVLEAADGGLLAAMSDESELACVDRDLGTVWEILRLDNSPTPAAAAPTAPSTPRSSCGRSAATARSGSAPSGWTPIWWATSSAA